MEIEIYRKLYNSFDDLLDWSLDTVQMQLKRQISREEWEEIQCDKFGLILKENDLKVILNETITKTI